MSQAVAHAVYFKLKDSTAAGIAALIADCQEKLDGHPGVQYFCVGERGAGFDRPVNDQDFDVALFLVFDDRQTHDTYQASERHQQFIAANRETWASVRVFDSVLS